MSDTLVCVCGFVAYLVFIIVLVLTAKSTGFLQSGFSDLLKTFKERLDAKDNYGAFLAFGLVALRIVMNTGVLSFFAAGFAAVAGICSFWNLETLKVIREILQDFYKFIESLHRKADAVSRALFTLHLTCKKPAAAIAVGAGAAHASAQVTPLSVGLS